MFDLSLLLFVCLVFVFCVSCFVNSEDQLERFQIFAGLLLDGMGISRRKECDVDLMRSLKDA